MINNSYKPNSKRRNYGALTAISRELNATFGDKTGRSISIRTAHGFKRTFDIRDIDDNTAEDIVHSVMVLTPILLSKRNEPANAAGILLLACLVGSYLNGK